MEKGANSLPPLIKEALCQIGETGSGGGKNVNSLRQRPTP